MSEEQLEEILKNYAFVFTGGRACNYFFRASFMLTYTLNYKKWPVPFEVMGSMINHVDKWYFVVPKEFSWEKYLELFIKDKTKLPALEKFINKEAALMLNPLSLDFSKMSQIKLKEVASKTIADLNYSSATLRILDLAIQKWAKQRFSVEEMNSFLRIASVSKKKSSAMLEEVALLKLAQKVLTKKGSVNDKWVEKELKKIMNSFCWVVCGYYNEKARTYYDYNQLLVEYLRKNPKNLLNEIETRHKIDLNERKKLLSKLDKKEIIIANLAAESSWLKDLYKFKVNEVIFRSEPMFEEIAKRTGVSTDYAKNLFPTELLDVIGGKQVDPAFVDARTKRNILLIVKGRPYSIVGAQADYFEKKYLQEKGSATGEFVGRVACEGSAVGEVIIIHGKNDFGKMKQGAILVAINTSPDYVPLMKMASAVLVEEGGLTSHASVVSRELGVPCIVGLRKITDFLKDGDKVSVDAKKGVVKVISN